MHYHTLANYSAIICKFLNFSYLEDFLVGSSYSLNYSSDDNVLLRLVSTIFRSQFTNAEGYVIKDK